MKTPNLETVEILGIKVNPVTYQEAVKTIFSWLKDKKPRYVVTPNPEIITYAQPSFHFAKILNNADLSIPDGTGLIWASGGKIKSTITGTDLMLKLCSLAFKKNWKIGLLGGLGDTAKITAQKLKNLYPSIKIVYARSGGKIDKFGSPKTKLPLPNQKLDILFVAFGFPKQEHWIAKNKNSFPAKVFIPVGGAFDYISGKFKRAPLFLRQLGLEWLYRLITQPHRLARQLKGTKFFYLVLKEKF